MSAAQLAALSDTLAHPAPAGTVLALHHPPIYTATAPWTVGFGLQNRDELAAVIEGTDVVVVLCGHFHLQLTGILGGATVWTTPGIVTRIDLTASPSVVRAVHGAGATVVDLGGPFSPSFHVVHSRDEMAGQPVYVVDPVTWEETSE